MSDDVRILLERLERLLENVHQYVGARYVPNFIEEPWNDIRGYEALDVVDNGTGTSYIAKKPVPPGTPLSNREYWFVYGSTSGAIINLQNQIDSIISDIGDINDNISVTSFWHNKRVCVYGDSLSTVTHNYWKYMAEYDPSVQITNRAVGGTRIQQVIPLIQQATDLDDFDVIVLAFGTNNWQGNDYKSIFTYYVSAFTEIIARAPLAQIVCITPFYSYKPEFGISTIDDDGFGIYDYCNEICYVASMYGAISYNLYDISGVNQYNYTTYLENSNNVYVHENELLGRRIAKLLLNDNKYSCAPISAKSYVVGAGQIVFYKTASVTFVQSYGTCDVSALLALDLPELAGALVPGCIARGGNLKNTALVGFTTAGKFVVDWNDGNADTTVQGISFAIFRGFYQPH